MGSSTKNFIYANRVIGTHSILNREISNFATVTNATLYDDWDDVKENCPANAMYRLAKNSNNTVFRFINGDTVRDPKVTDRWETFTAEPLSSDWTRVVQSHTVGDPVITLISNPTYLAFYDYETTNSKLKVTASNVDNIEAGGFNTQFFINNAWGELQVGETFQCVIRPELDPTKYTYSVFGTTIPDDSVGYWTLFMIGVADHATTPTKLAYFMIENYQHLSRLRPDRAPAVLDPNDYDSILEVYDMAYFVNSLAPVYGSHLTDLVTLNDLDNNVSYLTNEVGKWEFAVKRTGTTTLQFYLNGTLIGSGSIDFTPAAVTVGVNTFKSGGAEVGLNAMYLDECGIHTTL